MHCSRHYLFEFCNRLDWHLVQEQPFVDIELKDGGGH
jgi:hypothetical protein